jgi:O-antigen/teichoic acid export membrane protein
MTKGVEISHHKYMIFQTLQQLLGLATIPILTRNLSLGDFADYSVLANVIISVGLVGTFGMQDYVIRLLTLKKRASKDVFIQILKLFHVLCLPAMLIASGIIFILVENQKITFALTALVLVAIVIEVYNNILIGFAIGTKQNSLLSTVPLFASFTRVLALYILSITNDLNLFTAILALIMPHAIAATATTIYIVARSQKANRADENGTSADILRGGLKLFIPLLNAIFISRGVLILAYPLMDSLSYANFAIALTIYSILQAFPTSLRIKILSLGIGSTTFLKNNFGKISVLALTIPITAAALSPPLLSNVLGSNFYGVTRFLFMLVPVFLLNVASHVLIALHSQDDNLRTLNLISSFGAILLFIGAFSFREFEAIGMIASLGLCHLTIVICSVGVLGKRRI